MYVDNTLLFLSLCTVNSSNFKQNFQIQSAVNLIAIVVTNYELLFFQVFELCHIFEGFIGLFITQSVSRQFHSLFQSEFATYCDLVILFSLISSTSCLHLLPRLSHFFINNVSEKVGPTRFISSFSLPSFYCLYDIFSPPWLCIILRFSHDYFFSSTTFQNFPGISNFWIPQVSAPYKAVLQFSISLLAFVNSSPICWWIECVCWMLRWPWQCWI
jgi:hypothetical protein